MEKFKPAQLSRPLKDEPNLSILKEISNSSNNKRAADSAFNEFYCRFYKYVWNMTYRVCSNFSKKNTMAEDLFQDVFQRVYIKANLLIQGKEGEISDVTIKAWLGRIGNNALIDYIRLNGVENDRTDFIAEVHDGRDVQIGQMEEGALDIKQISLSQAMDKLSEKDKDILYLYLYKTEKKVSSNDLKNLSSKYGVGTEAIRRAYYRILDDLKKQLQP